MFPGGELWGILLMTEYDSGMFGERRRWAMGSENVKYRVM